VATLKVTVLRPPSVLAKLMACDATAATRLAQAVVPAPATSSTVTVLLAAEAYLSSKVPSTFSATMSNVKAVPASLVYSGFRKMGLLTKLFRPAPVSRHSKLTGVVVAGARHCTAALFESELTQLALFALQQME